VTVADQGSNFYISANHVGATTRAEASITQLAELNSYVQVSVLPEFNDACVNDFHVIVVTENFWGTTRLAEINALTRAGGKGFILSETMGVSAYAFLDYGPDFTVTDKDGEPNRQFIISSIE